MTKHSESIISEELRHCIGRTSPLARLELLSISDVRRYVDATGDANPLWLDDDFAHSAGYRGRILPPILVGWVPFSLKERETRNNVFSLRRQLPVPETYTNVRNVGAETEWMNPVPLGEHLWSQSRIVEITTHAGRMGVGIYITEEEEVKNAQHEVFLRRRHTIALFPEQAQSVQQD